MRRLHPQTGSYYLNLTGLILGALTTVAGSIALASENCGLAFFGVTGLLLSLALALWSWRRATHVIFETRHRRIYFEDYDGIDRMRATQWALLLEGWEPIYDDESGPDFDPMNAPPGVYRMFKFLKEHNRRDRLAIASGKKLDRSSEIDRAELRRFFDSCGKRPLALFDDRRAWWKAGVGHTIFAPRPRWVVLIFAAIIRRTRQ